MVTVTTGRTRAVAVAVVAAAAGNGGVSMAARAMCDNLYCFIFVVDLIVNIRFVPENHLPRRACTKSTRHHIDIAAKTAKKIMVSHRGVSVMKRVSSFISGFVCD